jgi:hypothetical protein
MRGFAPAPLAFRQGVSGRQLDYIKGTPNRRPLQISDSALPEDVTAPSDSSRDIGWRSVEHRVF